MKQFSWCQENVTRGITAAENTAKRSLYKKKQKQRFIAVQTYQKLNLV